MESKNNTGEMNKIIERLGSLKKLKSFQSKFLDKIKSLCGATGFLGVLTTVAAVASITQAVRQQDPPSNGGGYKKSHKKRIQRSQRKIRRKNKRTKRKNKRTHKKVKRTHRKIKKSYNP